MALARASLLVFALTLAAACGPSHPAARQPSVPTADPCALVIAFPIAFTSNAGGYVATWPSPPSVGAAGGGRLNSQQVSSHGNPALHDLGSQGPLALSHRFSVHYSLQGTEGTPGGCDQSAAFWSLDCQDGSSRYADLWAHSDPCIWDDGLL
jgi:hypothetical protein